MKKTNKQILEIAKNIKAVVCDGDGVLFPSWVSMEVGEGGKYKVATKIRDHVDGQGISFLRAVDIRAAFITAESDGCAGAIADKLNGLPSVKSGKWKEVACFSGQIGKDKVATIGNWLQENGISWGEVAYMGDDIGDYLIMQKVGLPSAPAQAQDIIKNISLFIADREGGKGAIRSLCNFILSAKGVDVTTLDLK